MLIKDIEDFVHRWALIITERFTEECNDIADGTRTNNHRLN